MIFIIIPFFIKSGKLIQVLEHKLNMESGFYIVTPRHSKKTENLTKVRDWLISYYS